MPISAKRKHKKAHNVTHKTNSALGKFDNIDVKKLEDIAKLTDHIKNNVATLLLVYADWCGHCQTFKKDIWKNLSSVPNRKVAMAQINESVLSQSPFADLKMDGYPTVALVDKHSKAVVNKDPDTGEATNSLSNTRDMSAMSKLVTSDPAEALTNNSEEDDDGRSALPTTEAKKALTQAGNDAVKNLNDGESMVDATTSKTIDTPPSIEDDIMSSETMTPDASASATAKIGGALYDSLMNELKDQEGAPITYTGSGGTRRKKLRRKLTAKRHRRR